MVGPLGRGLRLAEGSRGFGRGLGRERQGLDALHGREATGRVLRHLRAVITE
jgi:hypothetical protein